MPTKKPTLLIVDDEKNTREGLMRALKYDYKLTQAENAEMALELLKENSYELMLSDVKMPGMDGVSLVKAMKRQNYATTCLIMTAYGDMNLAIEAMKSGAADFLTKPLDLTHVEESLRAAYKSHQRSQSLLVEEKTDKVKKKKAKTNDPDLIAEAPAMKDILATVEQVADARATVLLTGESGTGKEVIAHTIHQRGNRQKAPFVAVHCAALNANILESELFGHEKGSFTGASEMRQGRFERADGGTLFLDEIGEIDASTQVKLLRVLESRSFERVGGSESIHVDVRIIAATNRDLKAMVEAGTFREDLYYRLNILNIELPSLRHRREDIEAMLELYLNKFAAENNRQVDGFSAEALTALSHYNWPGNVRELRNIVERLVIMTRSNTIGVDDLPSEIRQAQSNETQIVLDNCDLDIENKEKELILQALEKTDNNKTAAAKMLGISRRTLHRKLDSYGLDK